MYEIKETLKEIDGHSVITYQRDIVDHNILEVEAGTNGYHGKPYEGGCTYFRIKDAGSTCMKINLIPNHYNAPEFEVILAGDSELDTIIEALKFITQALEDGRKEVFD